MSLYYTMVIPRLIIVCRSYESHIGLLLDKPTWLLLSYTPSVQRPNSA